MCSSENSPRHDAQSSDHLENFSYDTLSRRDIRSLLLHILYAIESREYEDSAPDIIENFNQGFDLNIPLDGEVSQTAQAIIQDRENLDHIYTPFLANWRFDRIGVCTRLILRLAVWELVYTPTESSIIINEAVELAKCFAEHDAFRFINGILDRVTQDVRKKS